MRAVSGDPSTNGTGIDNHECAVERGRSLAAERGLGERVAFVHGDATTWAKPVDRVICVGASHAYGGADATPAAKGRWPES